MKWLWIQLSSWKYKISQGRSLKNKERSANLSWIVILSGLMMASEYVAQRCVTCGLFDVIFYFTTLGLGANDIASLYFYFFSV